MHTKSQASVLTLNMSVNCKQTIEYEAIGTLY